MGIPAIFFVHEAVLLLHWLEMQFKMLLVLNSVDIHLNFKLFPVWLVHSPLSLAQATPWLPWTHHGVTHVSLRPSLRIMEAILDLRAECHLFALH